MSVGQLIIIFGCPATFLVVPGARTTKISNAVDNNVPEGRCPLAPGIGTCKFAHIYAYLITSLHGCSLALMPKVSIMSPLGLKAPGTACRLTHQVIILNGWLPKVPAALPTHTKYCVRRVPAWTGYDRSGCQQICYSTKS